MNELDKVIKNKKIYELSYDLMFKATLKKCPRILMKLINDCCNTNFSYDKDSIEIIDGLLEIDNINSKSMCCDCIVLINKRELYNIEINKGYYEGLYVRNIAYLFRNFITLFLKGMTYREYSNCKATQINFNMFHNDNYKVDRHCMICDIKDVGILTDAIKIIQIDVAESYKLLYNNSDANMSKLVRWASIFKENTLEGISKILGEDMINMEDKKELLTKIEEASSDDDVVTRLSKIRMEGDYEAIVGSYQQMGLEKGMKQGMQQGMQQGMKQGMRKGMKQGLKQGIMDMIINMHNNGIKLETISKVANKSIKEIQDIISNY